MIFGLRFGSVSLSLLGLGSAVAIVVALTIPGTVGAIVAGVIAVVTLLATMQVAYWLHAIDREHTLAEPVIVGCLIGGARRRTWTNHDVLVED
ncbi:MAG: hypothetical protein WCE30_21825 [Mycobacterium sp.]